MDNFIILQFVCIIIIIIFFLLVQSISSTIKYIYNVLTYFKVLQKI